MVLISALLLATALPQTPTEILVEIRIPPGNAPPILADADDAIVTRAMPGPGGEVRLSSRLTLPATVGGEPVSALDGATWEVLRGGAFRVSEHRMIATAQVPPPSGAWVAGLWAAIIAAMAWVLRPRNA